MENEKKETSNGTDNSGVVDSIGKSRIIDLNEQNKYKHNEQNKKIRRYPYNGESNYLILKIMLIGYEKNNLEKLIKKKEREREKNEKEGEGEKDKEMEIERKTMSSIKDSESSGIKKQERKKEEENNQSKGFYLGELPVILQSFSLSDFNCIENEMILELMYPREPKVIPVDQDKLEKNKIQHVVFSFNIPLDQGRKSSHNFYSYLDYDRVIIDKQNHYMIPRGICFLSNYPYFDNYFALSTYYNQYINKKSFSEIWFYYLINLPSPINCSYKLSHFSPTDENHSKPIFFPQLSGYPLFQFKLIELFNILPVEFIIEIFFFSFLENDMIFYSKHLEILNIVMYIFSQFNYPCNDSTYFFHILSLGLKEFKRGLNPYVTKTFSCMFGVNASYDPKYDVHVKKNDYFVVDLEKKEIHYRYKAYKSESYDIKSNITLINYIHQILSSLKEEVPKINNSLGRLIFELYVSLRELSHHITHANITNIFAQEPSFFGNTDNYFLINKSIQEKFYSFNLSILSQFYEFYSFAFPTNNDNKYTIDFNDSKIIESNDEIETIFVKKFKECSKFNTYISNFIQNNDSLDLFKIPLLFSEEFIWQLKWDKTPNKKTYSLFQTIDNFYQIHEKFGIVLNFNHYYEWIKKPSNSKQLIKLNEELKDYTFAVKVNKKNPKPRFIEMTPQELYGYFVYFKNNQKEYKEIFQLDQSKIKYSVMSEKTYLHSNNPDESKVKDKIELDYNLLLNDTNKHLEKDILKRISSFKKKINDQTISETLLISPTYIQVEIEEKVIKEDKMSARDIIFCSYILLFVITRSVNKENTKNQLKIILDLLMQRRDLYSFRKFISMLVIQYTEVIEQKIFEKKEWIEEKKCLLELTHLLKNLNFIPNEELLLYLHIAYSKGYIKKEELESQNDMTLHEQTEEFEKLDVELNSKNNQRFSNSGNKRNKNTTYLQNNVAKDGIKKEDYVLNLALNNTKFNGIILIPESEKVRKASITTFTPTPIQIPTPTPTLTSTPIPTPDKALCWVVIYENEKYSTPIFSPLKLYYSITKMNKLIKTDLLLLNNKEKKRMNEICCNLIFYIQNIKDLFQNKNAKCEKNKNFNEQQNINEVNRNSIHSDDKKYLLLIYDALEIINKIEVIKTS